MADLFKTTKLLRYLFQLCYDEIKSSDFKLIKFKSGKIFKS